MNVKPGENMTNHQFLHFFQIKMIASSIDIDQIKSLGAKQQFINSTGG
jgi:hypothetical protein